MYVFLSARFFNISRDETGLTCRVSTRARRNRTSASRPVRDNKTESIPSAKVAGKNPTPGAGTRDFRLHVPLFSPSGNLYLVREGYFSATSVAFWKNEAQSCTRASTDASRVQGQRDAKWPAGLDAARARVLIMFFQNKWAFRWVRRRRWRCFHGVPGNHGNPVTPLSGHGVSLPRRWGYLRAGTGDERREGHNAPAVDLSPCVRLSELVVRSSRILGEPRQEGRKEREGGGRNPHKNK